MHQLLRLLADVDLSPAGIDRLALDLADDEHADGELTISLDRAIVGGQLL